MDQYLLESMKNDGKWGEGLNCVDNDFYRHNKEVLEKKFGKDLKGPKFDLHWTDDDVRASFWKTEGDLDTDYARELLNSGSHHYHEMNK